MIILGIEICFVAHLNSMAEALFFNWLWSSASFYFCKYDFNDSFTVFTIIGRKLYTCTGTLQHQNSPKICNSLQATQCECIILYGNINKLI